MFKKVFKLELFLLITTEKLGLAWSESALEIVRGNYCKFSFNKDDIDYHTELEVDNCILVLYTV